MKNYSFFVGIDIGKENLAVSVTHDGIKSTMPFSAFANNPKGFAKMLRWLTSQYKNLELQGPWLFCMEHTGIYTLRLCSFLQNKALDYVLESALQIKRSLGIKRGKADKADSRDIARYVYLHCKDLKISELPCDTLLKIKHLLTYRNQLLKYKNALKVSSRELKKSCDKSLCAGIPESSEMFIEKYNQEIKKVEKQMKMLLRQDEQLSRLFDLVSSVKGIGLIISLKMLVHTKAFKTFDKPRQFACYIGIAPFAFNSGTSINKPDKVSHLANKRLKALLTNAALSAVRYDKELKQYYKRKTEEGKNEFLVLNAVKNKLIHRIFAVVKRGSPFVELARYA